MASRPTQHGRLQRRYRAALDAQIVVALGDLERDELSWNAADVAASRTDEEDLRAALLAELAHRGVGEDHGVAALHQLAAVLLEASDPTPATTPGAASGAASSWTTTPWGRDEAADRDALRGQWPSDVAPACEHLLAASGTPVDAVAVVDSSQRLRWERRWPRWPRWLGRRLQGVAPALLLVSGVTVPESR